ncbi:MAG TPA: hypothetical protein VFI29_12740 [Hanamia sp.]|nr:hypothetical protein [Hanamia sp.]
MEPIKQTLFTNWHFMRWLRLVFGIIFMVQALQMHDMLVGAIAGFFLITAVTNIGCCGAKSCATPTRKDAEESAEEISFEEIKNK